MRVQATASESDLSKLKPGGKVRIEFLYVDSGEKAVTGSIEKVSRLASSAASADGENEEASYAVTIRLDDTDGVYYGMNVAVTTMEGTAETTPAAAPAAPVSEEENP